MQSDLAAHIRCAECEQCVRLQDRSAPEEIYRVVNASDAIRMDAAELKDQVQAERAEAEESDDQDAVTAAVPAPPKQQPQGFTLLHHASWPQTDKQRSSLQRRTTLLCQHSAEHSSQQLTCPVHGTTTLHSQQSRYNQHSYAWHTRQCWTCRTAKHASACGPLQTQCWHQGTCLLLIALLSIWLSLPAVSCHHSRKTCQLCSVQPNLYLLLLATGSACLLNLLLQRWLQPSLHNGQHASFDLWRHFAILCTCLAL